MPRFRFLLGVLACGLMHSGLAGLRCGLAKAQSTPVAQTLYQVGNSFTVDSQPLGIYALAENAGEDFNGGFHIRSGSSATTIVNNATDFDVIRSGSFTEALPNNAWDHIALQPFRDTNATLASEINAIDGLIDLAKSNPANAGSRLYLYQPWAFRGGVNGPDQWESPIPEPIDQEVTLRRDFFIRLHDEIEAEGHDLTVIPAGDVVYRVFQEIEAGNIVGLTDRNDLYVDGLHLTRSVGRFVAGTTVLTTILGRDLTGVESPDDFYGTDTDLPDALRDQLQSIVWDVVRSHPETDLTGVRTAGDYDFDGGVGPGDYQVWQAGFGSTTRQSADGDQDYLVSAADYAIWRDSVQLPETAALSIGVPEPTTATLLLAGAGATGLLVRRRR